MSKTMMRFMLIFACAMFSANTLAADSAEREQLIKQGEYLAQIGGCVSCHSAADNQPLTGGVPIKTPFGKIYSTNITPDIDTGIGSWKFEDFWQAMHHGKGPKGKLLYPAFPFTSYTKVTRDDALALYTYLQYLPAIEQTNRKNSLNFPFNLRSLLHGWRLVNFSAGEYEPQSDQSDEWNRGAYLVQGIGHCNECHTTRNFMGAVDKKQPFAGGVIPEQEWYAPGLSMQEGGDLADWSKDDLIDLLKTGLSSKGSALGPMAEVVHNSTQHLTDEDLDAMAVYLADLKPAKKSKPASSEAQDLELGQELYDQHCESCHGKSGQGVDDVYPSLVGNTTVLAESADNAIRAVLMGGFVVATEHNPEPYSMPPFASELDNEEVAAVVNYIRQSWDNDAPAIAEDAVRRLRFKPLR